MDKKVVQRVVQYGATNLEAKLNMGALNKLSDAQLRSGNIEICDGGGLYFKRTGPNTAHWYFRSRAANIGGKFGLGGYPTISLKQARIEAGNCRVLIAQGIDVGEERRRLRKTNATPMTFKEAAHKKFDSIKPKLRGKNQSGEWIRQLENHAFGKIGRLKVRELTVDNILDVLSPIWRDHHPTAKKIANRTEQILKYTQATEIGVDVRLVERARELLGPAGHIVDHHAAQPWQEMPKLFSTFGNDLPQLAFKLYILTVVRVTPVRTMKWSEIKEDMWALDTGRMKSGKAFNVPLSDAARVIIETVRNKYEKKSEFVFPNAKAKQRGIITENAFNNMLKDAGFNSTAHGIRSSFRDWCGDNEICTRDLAEMCLHHETMDEVEAAYFRSDLFKQRAEIIQKWGKFVSGNLNFDSPYFKREDEEGYDMSISLADIYSEQEETENEEKRERTRSFNSDPKAVASWYRKTDIENE
ncbi:MAG: tyrosine-type recombinase/integrase [Paracoccaceae bacterium]